MFSCEKNLLPPYLAASESYRHPGNCSLFQVEKSKEGCKGSAQQNSDTDLTCVRVKLSQGKDEHRVRRQLLIVW